jgi:hypothetical protein
MIYLRLDENGNLKSFSTESGDIAINESLKKYFKFGANVLETFKKLKLKEVKECIDNKYKEYLAKYPEVEVDSFQNKAKEALLVKKDSNTALEDTPYLSALANNTMDARNALADAVNNKIVEAAQLESNGVALRDSVLNATTIEDVKNIQCV